MAAADFQSSIHEVIDLNILYLGGVDGLHYMGHGGWDQAMYMCICRGL